MFLPACVRRNSPCSIINACKPKHFPFSSSDSSQTDGVGWERLCCCPAPWLDILTPYGSNPRCKGTSPNADSFPSFSYRAGNSEAPRAAGSSHAAWMHCSWGEKLQRPAQLCCFRCVQKYTRVLAKLQAVHCPSAGVYYHMCTRVNTHGSWQMLGTRPVPLLFLDPGYEKTFCCRQMAQASCAQDPWAAAKDASELAAVERLAASSKGREMSMCASAPGGNPTPESSTELVPTPAS